jgi:hypothetical protein
MNVPSSAEISARSPVIGPNLVWRLEYVRGTGAHLSSSFDFVARFLPSLPEFYLLMHDYLYVEKSSWPFFQMQVKAPAKF